MQLAFVLRAEADTEGKLIVWSRRLYGGSVECWAGTLKPQAL